MHHFVTGSRPRWNPLDSSHGAHLHLPRAAQEILWHSHRLLISLSRAALQPSTLHPHSTPSALYSGHHPGKKGSLVQLFLDLCMFFFSFFCSQRAMALIIVSSSFYKEQTLERMISFIGLDCQNDAVKEDAKFKRGVLVWPKGLGEKIEMRSCRCSISSVISVGLVRWERINLN